MQINLHFDPAGKVETPTFILAYKSGKRIGQLTNVYNIKLSDSMSEAPSFSFDIDKYNNEEITPFWNDLTTFKLVYCEEYDTWFEATVEYSDSTEVTKQITLTRLGESELQSVNVYGLNVNTEDDIARDDYVVTKLYSTNPDGSLLHRILSFAPHYDIAYVDPSVRDIQREFSFNEQSVYECLQAVAEEENLYINYNSSLSTSNKIQRSISVYDLFSNCHDCGYRGNFTGTCPKCGGTHITEGYGHNTTICVSREDLGQDITVSDNVDKIRNCYHVSGGDDLVTATVRNCNLTGGKSYLWRFTNEMKNDMSQELHNKIDTYEALYNQYMNNEVINLSNYVTKEDGSTKSLNVSAYNTVIRKYQNLVRGLYDVEIAQLQTIYNNAVAKRQAAYPSAHYVGNVDINHRPVVYNSSDKSYSVGDSDYIYFVDGDNYIFYYFTHIRSNGDIMSDEEVITYLNSFRTGTPNTDMSADNSRYKILYKVEVTSKSNFDDECVAGNKYLSDIESAYRDIYGEEGKDLCRLEEAKSEKSGVGNPTSSTSSLLEITNPTGFPELITAWYNTYDVYYYLHDSLMPIPSLYNLSATTVVNGLTAQALSPIAVADLNYLTLEIAQNAVLGSAKIVADPAFKIELAESALNASTHVWSGKFKVTSLYNEDDVATSASTISITITDNYSDYVSNRLQRQLYNSSKNDKNIIRMLNLNESNFKSELAKYSLVELRSIRDCFEGCVSVLSKMGAEDSQHEAHSIYVDMRNKVTWSESEASVRENECNVVMAMCGTNAKVNSSANPFGLLNIKIDIQKYLDLENYLGAILWTELNAIRREEAFTDSNYISNGLENGELIRRSYELLQAAEQKIAENNLYSYEINATLKNLLLIPEFAPLKDNLVCGNWIRIKTDDNKLYKLRLVSYEFGFDNPETLSVSFSDITDTSNIRSVQSLIRRMDYLTKNTPQTIVSKFEYITDSLDNSNASTRSSLNEVSNTMNDLSEDMNVSMTSLDSREATHFSITSGAITSEVERATGVEDGLSSRIDQTEEKITMKVDETHGDQVTGFSWTLNSTGHTWYRNRQQVMKVDGSGLTVTGNITGSVISGSQFYCGTYGSETTYIDSAGQEARFANGTVRFKDVTNEGVREITSSLANYLLSISYWPNANEGIVSFGNSSTKLGAFDIINPDFFHINCFYSENDSRNLNIFHFNHDDSKIEIGSLSNRTQMVDNTYIGGKRIDFWSDNNSNIYFNMKKLQDIIDDSSNAITVANRAETAANSAIQWGSASGIEKTSHNALALNAPNHSGNVHVGLSSSQVSICSSSGSLKIKENNVTFHQLRIGNTTYHLLGYTE